jgi:hypothetical protein
MPPLQLAVRPRPATALMDGVVDLLATYRLTTLIKDDKITEDLRGAVFRRYGPPDDEQAHKMSYLMSCPWCLSMYFGAIAVLFRSRNPRLWSPVAKVLALSALTGLLSEHRSSATGH